MAKNLVRLIEERKSREWKKIRDWVVLWMDFYSVSLVKSYVMTMHMEAV